MTKLEREAAARVRYVCPTCHAEAGKPCKKQGFGLSKDLWPHGAVPMKHIHPKRLALLPTDPAWVAARAALAATDTLAVLEGTTQQRIATARQLVAPPVTRSERTHVQYRIESKGRRGRAWHYYAFTGAFSGMLPPPEAGVYANDPVEKLRERIERAKVESPDLEYRIVGRTVVTTTETTRWEVVQ